MALVDFMDESSEMYMEARSGADQFERMDKKAKSDDLKWDKYSEKTGMHYANTHGKKGAVDAMRSIKNAEANGTEKDNKHIHYIGHALDAMDRHDRRHPDRKLKEGAIEFI